MPTEENQNVQTSGNPVTGDQSSNDNIEINNTVENIENNLDINLNLEGLDVPVESQIDPQMDLKIEEVEVLNPLTEDVVLESVDSVADASSNDWLIEEDKKVEELQQDDKNIDNIELHTENLGEDVMENSEGDIVSDTGDMNSDKNGYVPNEHDFEQITDALQSANEGGPIDLGPLEQNNDEGKNLDLGTGNENLNTVNVSNEGNADNGLDLDSMISDFKIDEFSVNDAKEEIKIDMNQKLNVELNENLKEDIIAEVETPIAEEQVNYIQMDTGPDGILAGAVKHIESVEPISTENLEVIAPVVAPVEVPVAVVNVPVVPVASVPQVTSPVVAAPVINDPVIGGLPAGAVIVSGPPQISTKNSHTGLKIFVFIIVLLVGGSFILNKMYPEEIGDMLGAIKGNNAMVVEYSDNSSMGAKLESQDDIIVNENDLNDDIVDPDSLAAQLEDNSDSLSGDVEIEQEQEGDITVEGEHNAENTEEFNAFEGIEDVIDAEVGENDELIYRLQEYQNQGNEYDSWGRDENNTTAIKYGLYISRNAEEIINNIENGVEIDTTEVENYFAQFDKYLSKLSSLRDEIDGESTADFAGQVQNDDLVSTGTDESNTESTTETVQ